MTAIAKIRKCSQQVYYFLNKIVGIMNVSKCQRTHLKLSSLLYGVRAYKQQLLTDSITQSLSQLCGEI